MVDVSAPAPTRACLFPRCVKPACARLCPFTTVRRERGKKIRLVPLQLSLSRPLRTRYSVVSGRGTFDDDEDTVDFQGDGNACIFRAHVYAPASVRAARVIAAGVRSKGDSSQHCQHTCTE